MEKCMRAHVVLFLRSKLFKIVLVYIIYTQRFLNRKYYQNYIKGINLLYINKIDMFIIIKNTYILIGFQA